jgi:uncharacterized protein YndB with AHSA1/START domain
MNDTITPETDHRSSVDAFGVLPEPTTLKMQRLLPGPIERVWSYLTDSELRRQWLAAGAMAMKADAPFELVWRNSELSDPPGQRPPGFGEEHRMSGHIVEVDAPRKLVFTWGVAAEVTFELAPQGDQVLLTLHHRRVTERSVLLNVSAGWHAHLDVLAAKLQGRAPGPFWEAWSGLKETYTQRFPG